MRSSLKLLISVAITSLVLGSCQEPPPPKEKGLVYEGMSSAELRNVLGEPDSIDSRGEIFDANTMKKMSVEAWTYEKRNVLLINDTVKNPNLN